MNADLCFKAPWGKLLIAVTAISCLMLLGIVCIGLVTGPQSSDGSVGGSQLAWYSSMVILPLVILGITALYMVTGYSIKGETLYIHRLGWQTRINLTSLQSAEINSEAINRAIRLWGNGGLFSFTGHFRNPTDGRFQVFATDPEYGVMLTFPERKVWVTPDDPQGFIQAALQYPQPESSF